MASHARPPHQTRTARGLLLRAGLAVSVAGAALAVGAPAATAADGKSDPASLEDIRAATNSTVGALEQATSSGLGTVKNLRLNPLAGTGSDPLNNAVGTQIADFKPISTAVLTAPLANGASLGQLPVVGQLTQVLPG
ncbi:hypothetical protein [Streptomyces purpurogeneiscleroticus]|uniref:hypothetical protein n=1 Tax=Streptomyces purpurogeneiscleroticus TaxID=68259 RepID=UPI001CBC2947|nr:hypothetical protein [Streptomyces purpurogeneiscleroticus]MBZ4019680.1 hypothetical protein [Streptomyces purpurogeneiscleroticus]